MVQMIREKSRVLFMIIVTNHILFSDMVELRVKTVFNVVFLDLTNTSVAATSVAVKYNISKKNDVSTN